MFKRAIIIGAGPAGLTAALELLRQTDVVPIVLEASEEIGGISRTIRYKGNRMDIGGHRFFSKSDRVMQWWMELMPPTAVDGEDAPTISYHNQTRTLPTQPRGATQVIDTETVEEDVEGHVETRFGCGNFDLVATSTFNQQ